MGHPGNAILKSFVCESDDLTWGMHICSEVLQATALLRFLSVHMHTSRIAIDTQSIIGMNNTSDTIDMIAVADLTSAIVNSQMQY